MTVKEFIKKVKEIHGEAEIKIDSPSAFRIFIYSQKKKFPITALIDKQKYYKITKISDYPKQKGHYPVCVVRVDALCIKKKRIVKRKPATNTKQTAIIKENVIVKQNE